MAIEDTQRAAYELLTGEDDGCAYRDIPEEACDEQPRNFFKHVVSLAATKIGDGLADPKLVLSWLLTALGAPAYQVGLLVPLREAGALLPQLFIAGAIRSLARRKWAWCVGSLIQGLSVIGMGAAAFLLQGANAGWAIVALLAIFACARSVCSVSYKDVLGKTVAKSTRGTATGTASTLAAVIILGFGCLLSFGFLDKAVATIGAVLCAAGALWVLAALVFSTLSEQPGATEGGGNLGGVALRQVALLHKDPQLARFVLTRGLLVATALAPPYLLSLAGRTSENQIGQLGPFVVASALASVCSTYVWGRLSDKSSRQVLALSAVVGFIILGLAAFIGYFYTSLLAGALVPALLLFVLLIGYQGVRLGRSTHIVDMADEQTRAAYTALSNTIVGLLLMAGGLFGFLAETIGQAFVLAVFAVMCGLAATVALGLEEVQQEGL